MLVEGILRVHRHEDDRRFLPSLSLLVFHYICSMIDDAQIALFLKQTNILRDALYAKNKEHITDAYTNMHFRREEFAGLPKDLLIYFQGINKKALEFLKSED